jgi:hypothetical protein
MMTFKFSIIVELKSAAAVGCSALLALLVFEQVEDIGLYLRWIGVPTLIPVPINLPANTGKPMSVLDTPPANLGMGVAETRIRAEVGGSDCAAGGQP